MKIAKIIRKSIKNNRPMSKLFIVEKIRYYDDQNFVIRNTRLHVFAQLSSRGYWQYRSFNNNGSITTSDCSTAEVDAWHQAMDDKRALMAETLDVNNKKNNKKENRL